MPALKKPAASDLDWDAFPEPPPEAANWKSDPDLIERPGTLKDSRFDKSSYVKGKRAALRRDLRFQAGGYTSISVGNTSRLASPAVGSTPAVRPAIDSLPAQILRHLRSEHVIFKTGTIAEPFRSRIPPVIPLLKAPTTLTYITAPAAKMSAPTPQNSNVTKATTESMVVHDSFSTKLQPSALSISRSLSPKKGNIPAWAGPFEKLLAKGNSRKPAAVSMPPHLRKAANISNAPEGRVDTHEDSGLSLPASSHNQFTSAEDIYAAAVEASRCVSDSSAPAVIDEEDRLIDCALAWQLAISYLDIDDPKEGLALQEKINQDCGDKNPLCQDTTDELKPQHQRHLNIALIKVMELELNPENRTPSADLMFMNEKDFNGRFTKMRSAHMET